jgi:hypothetical protein
MELIVKGFIYICKMRYEGKSYYKIGRTTDLGKRELALRTANPFLKIVAKKISYRHQREEKEIHSAMKNRQFELEWYELTDDQYAVLVTGFHFENYPDDERAENLRLARIKYPKYQSEKPPSQHQSEKPSEQYHVFRKNKKTRAGVSFFRWYYYFYDQNGKKIQKACQGCNTRTEAENFIRTLPPEVNQKGQPMMFST